MSVVTPYSGRIIETIPTYSESGEQMVQDGYFYVLKDANLRWATNWQHANLAAAHPTKRTGLAYRLPEARKVAA